MTYYFALLAFLSKAKDDIINIIQVTLFINYSLAASNIYNYESCDPIVAAGTIYSCGSCDPHLYYGSQDEQDEVGQTEAWNDRVMIMIILKCEVNCKCRNPKQSGKNKC